MLTIYGKSIEEYTKEELWDLLAKSYEENNVLKLTISEYKVKNMILEARQEPKRWYQIWK